MEKLFTKHENAMVCLICGKVINSRRIASHAKTHINNNEVVEKRVSWYNDSRWTNVYYIKNGVKIVDDETLNLIKISISDDPKLVSPKPDIFFSNDFCSVCNNNTPTPFTYNRIPMTGHNWKVDGFRCKCGAIYNRQGVLIK